MDKKAIVCNITQPTKTAKLGALAYFACTSGGAIGDGRLNVYLRSRGGRWIEKWESLKRLGNFRLKTIPPEHPFYSNYHTVTKYENQEEAQKQLEFILFAQSEVNKVSRTV